MGIYKPKGQRLVAPAGGSTTLGGQILATQSASLLGYWPCDDVSGGLADQSGNNNTMSELGTVPSGAYGQTGLVGDAVQGDGNGGWNTHVIFQVGGINPANGFTIMALINSPSGIDNTELMGFGSDSENREIRTLGSNSATGLNLGTQGDSVSKNSIATNTTQLSAVDTWHHIVLRGRTAAQGATGGGGGPDDLEWIVNNSADLIDTTTWWPTFLNNTGICSAYVDDDVGTYWSGLIQHVAAWSTPLSDSEISDIFDATGL